MSAFEDHSGKINSVLFKEMLQPKSGRRRDSVIKGPRFGVDTSVMSLGNKMGLAVSSDPVTLIPSLGLRESAWLSVHLLANDMATTGCSPQFAQFVLNLPDTFSLEQFEEYWGYIHEFCDLIGVAITGGHTAQVPGQNSTTPGGGTMFLHAPLDEIITSDRATPGDKIVVTKESALTASSMLAKSFPETVRKKCGKEIWQAACDNFYRTSSLQDALVASDALTPNVELKAMHDVTEGGILGAIVEMAEASGCGFRINNARLPESIVPQKVCNVFDIDHRLCVGAGAMIMAVKSGAEKKLTRHLRNESIAAAVVGEFRPMEEAQVLIENDNEVPFYFDGNDPYWQAYFNAMEAGWK